MASPITIFKAQTIGLTISEINRLSTEDLREVAQAMQLLLPEENPDRYTLAKRILHRRA